MREREVWRTGGRGRCGGQEGEGGVEDRRERKDIYLCTQSHPSKPCHCESYTVNI